jgi:hypothetical protein
MAAMNESDSGAASGASERLIRAVRHVLHPLVRLLLAQGLTYPWLSDMLKGIFVDVADRDFQLAGKRQTDSRVSLLTGVHRKDVRRLRDEDGDRSSRMPPAVSLGSQLVARWVTTPRYLDEEGMPIPLARLASQGGELSFEALVATVSKDIRARAVLDEWMRLGVALLDADDRVILNSEAFVPARGFDEKVFYFGQNVHDHVSTAVDNVIGVEPAQLERSVHYDTLTPQSVAELERLAGRLGMQALKSLNRRAAELAARDADDPAAVERMNFGVYFHREPMPADGQDENRV